MVSNFAQSIVWPWIEANVEGAVGLQAAKKGAHVSGEKKEFSTNQDLTVRLHA